MSHAKRRPSNPASNLSGPLGHLQLLAGGSSLTAVREDQSQAVPLASPPWFPVTGPIMSRKPADVASKERNEYV